MGTVCTACLYLLCVCCSASGDDAVVSHYQITPIYQVPLSLSCPSDVLRFCSGDDCISFVVVTGSESLGSLGSLLYLCSCGSALWGTMHTVLRQHGMCPGYLCPTSLSLLDIAFRSLPLRYWSIWSKGGMGFVDLGYPLVGLVSSYI